MPPTRSTFLLLAASLPEVLPLLRRLDLRGRAPEFTGQVASCRVHLRLTGVGPAAAGRVAAAAMDALTPRQVFLLGFAGALDPTLVVGEVRRIATVMDQQGQAWRLADEGPPTPANPPADLVTVDHLAGDPQRKARLRGRYPGTQLVDMETAAVARAAGGRGLPLAVLRVVSDAADDSLPAPSAAWVGADGSINTAAVLRWLALRPHRLPALLRLRRTSLRIAEHLAQAAEVVVRDAAGA